MKNNFSYNIKLNKFLWIFLPIFIYLYPYLLSIPGFDFETKLLYHFGIYNRFHHEYGLIENLTAVFLIIAIVLGVRLSLINRKLPRFYFILLTLGSFYFLGEELSWGQTFFLWETHGTLGNINTQSETNVHNLPGIYNEIFAKIPRFILSVVSITAGFLIPVWFHKKQIQFKTDSINRWIWPSFICSFTAIFANIVALPYKILYNLDKEAPSFLQIDYGETKECFLALFICLYMLTSYKYFLLVRSEKETAGDQKIIDTSSITSA